MEYAALGTIVFASMILPAIVWIVLMIKEKNRRIRQMILSLCGAVLYFVMQWGIKEKGLQWLYNHKSTTGIDMNQFSINHYFLNLFLVSLVGALFLYGVTGVLLRFVFKKNYSYRNIIFYGLGYCISEAVMLAGIRSIETIVAMVQKSEGVLSTSVTELFLSAYERILIMVIEIALLVILAYFVQKGHTVSGVAITVLCNTLFGFLPAFFLAFSTVQYLSLYSRTTALVMIYVFLSVSALTGIVILWNFRYSFTTEIVQKKRQKEKGIAGKKDCILKE